MPFIVSKDSEVTEPDVFQNLSTLYINYIVSSGKSSSGEKSLNGPLDIVD